MIRTPVCDLLGIEHPVALGGMGSVFAPDLVAAVSNAGGLGALGCHHLTPDQVRNATAAIRDKTNKPFGLNFLLFDMREDSYAAALALRPNVIAMAWPRPEQDLRPLIARAHDSGAKITFMAGGVPEARRAAEAGADIIVAQGTEGGRPCRVAGADQEVAMLRGLGLCLLLSAVVIPAAAQSAVVGGQDTVLISAEEVLLLLGMIYAGYSAYQAFNASPIKLGDDPTLPRYMTQPSQYRLGAIVFVATCLLVYALIAYFHQALMPVAKQLFPQFYQIIQTWMTGDTLSYPLVVIAAAVSLSPY